jgi:hypothetical protein
MSHQKQRPRILIARAHEVESRTDPKRFPLEVAKELVDSALVNKKRPARKTAGANRLGGKADGRVLRADLDRLPSTRTHLPHDTAPTSGAPRPTLEQAKTVAGQVGVTEQEAEEWWNARQTSAWRRSMKRGGTISVALNWHADLKAYTNRAHERKAHMAEKEKVVHGTGN